MLLPDTLLLPSGEKATELTKLLCALCFSALIELRPSMGSALGSGLDVGSERTLTCRSRRISCFNLM